LQRKRLIAAWKLAFKWSFAEVRQLLLSLSASKQKAAITAVVNREIT